MHEEDIKRFEQGSPIRIVSRLHRLNLNSLADPMATIGMARGMLPFVMEVLACEGVNQEDISKSLSIDRAATARALQRLEADGFIRREEASGDRRRKRVYATPRLQELRDVIMGILKRQNDILFSGFDVQERAQLLNMLDRMIENISAR